MSDLQPTLKTKTYNINNQRLYKEIDQFMIELFASASVDWTIEDHREMMVDMVEDTLYEIADATGLITQFDVMCDRRNNTRSINRGGSVNFTLKYKQKNCLNTTVIEYTLAV